jgi:4-aminobutyrate aminotransferase
MLQNIKEVPYIEVIPPGEKAQKVLARDEQIISPSYVRYYPLVVKEARGCTIVDVDGNKYIDFNAGIACLPVGSCHPKVVEAIKKQAEKLLHYSLTDFYYEIAVELAEKI